jgi:hypothetical protein
MQLGGLEKVFAHRIDPVLEQHPAALELLPVLLK